METTVRVDRVELGPFRLVAPLGSGGMATVFRGRHVGDGTPVAVKVMSSGPGGLSDRRLEAFGREVDAVASLDHPRITSIYDYGVVREAGPFVPGSPYLVMELVEGGSANEHVGALTWPALRGLLLETLDALAHAHARGLVHRDIKPANILWNAGQGVKLADFGLAATRAELDVDDPAFEGTVQYMAPEQVELRFRDIGPATDLYALGCAAWKLATGSVPFSGSMRKVAVSHLELDPPEFESVVPTHIEFENWLRRLLRKRPARRPASAAAAAWELVRIPPPGGGAEAGDAPPGKGLRTLFFSSDIPSVVRHLRRRSRRDPAAGAPEPEFTQRERPPIPSAWRDPRSQGPRHLHGAGLNLVGKRNPGLVGRDAECELLWDRLLAVEADRRAHVVVIEGPTGCGKNALAARVAERAAELGAAQVLRVGHRAHHGAQDGVAQALLRYHRLVGLGSRAARKRLRRQLRSLGTKEPEELDALLGALHSAGDDDRTQEPRLRGRGERFGVLRRHLRRIAGPGIVVLRVETLGHGRDTVELLENLVEAPDGLPVLVLATLRTDEDSPIRAALDRLARGAETLPLAALDRDDSEALLRELVGLEPATANVVSRRASGNPMFAIELVRDWAARGILEASDDGFRVRDGVEPGFPSGLLDLWSERLSSVLAHRPPEDALSIEIAAAICQDVETRLWLRCCAAAGVTPLADLVPELLRAGLLTTHPGADGFSFTHAMVREALLLWAARNDRLAEHHGRIADVLAGVLPSRELARHLMAAGHAERALPLLNDASLRVILAGELGAAAELQDMSARATRDLGLPPDHPEVLRSALVAATILRRRGRADEARAELHGVLRHARARGLPEILAPALGALGVLEESLGHYADAETILDEAVDVARDHDVHATLLFVLRAQGYRLLRTGDVSGARDVFLEALDAAEAAGDRTAIARCRLFLARIALARGDELEARFQLAEARRGFERLGDRWGRAELTAVVADSDRMAGRLDDAARGYAEAASRYSGLGETDGVYVGIGAGLTALAQGSWGEACRRLEALLLRADALGLRDVAAQARTLLLTARAGAGNWERWDRIAAKAERGLRVTGIVSADLARSAERGAALCRAAGEEDRADRLDRIARDLRSRLR